MKLPKVVRFIAPIAESILFVVLFCSLLGCTTVLIEYLDAKKSPSAILQTLRVLKEFETKSQANMPAPQGLFDGQTIEDTIVALLEKAQPEDEVLIATYIITNNNICKAIKRKHAQGVKITMVADRSNAEKDHSRILELIHAGVCVYIYSPLESITMHNKFLVFKYATCPPVTITGSFNFTKSATEKNKENIILVRHPETALDYANGFEALVRNSVRVQVPTSKKASKFKKMTLEEMLKANGLFT